MGDLFALPKQPRNDLPAGPASKEQQQGYTCKCKKGKQKEGVGVGLLHRLRARSGLAGNAAGVQDAVFGLFQMDHVDAPFVGMELRMGFEPITFRLTAECSAVELSKREARSEPRRRVNPRPHIPHRLHHRHEDP